MRKPKNYWTKEHCKEEALKYKTKKEFNTCCISGYVIARKKGWLDEICSHMEIIGNLCHRLIYVYEFIDNSAYIGLTFNMVKRQKNRDCDIYDQVTKHINETGLKPICKILTDYIEVKEAIRLEGYYMTEYKNNGWTILNKAKTGSIGGNITKWNYENCSKEALKYKNRTEFYKKASSAYYASIRNSWLDEICSHMSIVNKKTTGYWTKERCQELSSTCNNSTELILISTSCYNIILRNNWNNELFLHFNSNKKEKNYWIKERCQEEALKYNSKTEFMANNNSAYSKSLKNDWIDEICSHMKILKKNSNYWSYKNCKEEALKYNSRIEFSKKCGSSYNSSKKNGWLDEICLHMNTIITNPKGYWTKERCQEEALKYNGRKKFRIGAGGAYKQSLKNGWLDEFYKNKSKI